MFGFGLHDESIPRNALLTKLMKCYFFFTAFTLVEDSVRHTSKSWKKHIDL